jgi:Xaa-Pro aminopeptidase
MKPSHSILLIKPNKATLFLSKLDLKPKLAHVFIKDIPKDWNLAFKDINIKKIGINKQFLTVGELEKLKKIYQKAKFVDISNILDELRSKKTSEEIKKVSKACEISSKTLENFCRSFNKNDFKTEQDVANFIEKEFRKAGAEVAFPTIVAMGKNASIPHHITSNSKLKKGFLLIDFGAKFQNYCADMTRMLYLGTPSKKEIEQYNLLLKAQEKAIENVEENKLFLELDQVARNVLGKFSDYFIHSLGHGIGVEVHEKPTFSTKDNYKIKHNHIFTIEPGIYITNKIGLRIEDTILFDGKVNILTQFSKKLCTIKY